MPKAKQKVEQEHEEEPAAEEVEEPVVEPVIEAVVAPPGVVRKPLGVKEVIPFKWKIIGKSHGMFVTLFKSVEEEESLAQLERLRREGYYSDLQVMDVNAKVEQPKQAGAKTTASAKWKEQVSEASKLAAKKKSGKPKEEPEPAPAKKPKASERVVAKSAPTKKVAAPKAAAKKTVKKR